MQTLSKTGRTAALSLFGAIVLSTLSNLSFGSLANAQIADVKVKHETRFSVKLGKILVGRMAFDINADKSKYVLTGTGKTDGLAEWFSSGKARIESKGDLTPEKAVPSHHFISISEKKTATLDMTLANGSVTNLVMKPDKSKKHLRKNYIRISDDEFKNIIDPASTLVVPVPVKKANDPKSACNQLFRVYDGEARYNMQLSYKKNAAIKTKGYDGYAYVCRLKYIPVAGHKKNHANSARMAKNNDMEIWLAPIAQTNLFTPIRIVVPTWIGNFYAEPDYFGPKPG